MDSFDGIFPNVAGLHGRFARQRDFVAVRDGEGAGSETSGISRHSVAVDGQFRRLFVGGIGSSHDAGCQRNQRPVADFNR